MTTVKKTLVKEALQRLNGDYACDMQICENIAAREGINTDTFIKEVFNSFTQLI